MRVLKTKKFILIFVIIVVMTGCSNETEQLRESNEQLVNQIKKLELKNEVLSGINRKLEGDVKRRTEENNELYSQIDILSGFRIEKEEEIIVDKRIELDALAVILTHFQAANEQNEEAYKKTIINTENTSLFSTWNQAKEGKKVILKKIEFYNRDNVGRSRYLLTVYFDNKTRGMPLLKYEDGWKIADLD